METNETFHCLPWFLKTWLLPIKESPKLVTLTQKSFAEGKDMEDRGAIGRRRHLCLSHTSAELLALPPSQEGPHFLAMEAAHDLHEGGRKLNIL